MKGQRSQGKRRGKVLLFYARRLTDKIASDIEGSENFHGGVSTNSAFLPIGMLISYTQKVDQATRLTLSMYEQTEQGCLSQSHEDLRGRSLDLD